MEQAAPRFIRRVLLIHLGAFIIIGILVSLAAKEVYTSARAEALLQAQKRQELLANQTTRAIESYYRSILDNLDLQRRAEESDQPDSPESEAPERAAPQRTFPERAIVDRPANDRVAPTTRAAAGRARQTPAMLGILMWDQLRGRATHFFSLDRKTMTAARDFTDNPGTSRQEIIQAAEPWLKTLEKPGISPPIQLHDGLGNLVVVPLHGAASRALIAVVPLSRVQRLFLDDVNGQRLMSAWLVDSTGSVMSAYDPRLIGLNFTQTGDPTIQEIATHCFSSGEGGTEVIDHPVKMGPLTLASAMTTMHPVTMPDTRWWLVIASGLDDVDAVVQRIFSRAIIWAIFVIITVTALFGSTSFFMIRSRIRVERMRRQILTNELEQARQIQLAWLPDRKRQAVSINVAAANVPASHISGDLYNWFDLPDGRSVVLIGDVTGHGMAAAFLMATTQLLVRMTMMSHGNAGESLCEVNRQLCAQGFSGQFVTMLLLVLNGNSVEIATAGHPSPLVCEDGAIRELELEPQLVLGVEAETEYASRTFELAEGASVLLYTDGVPDVLSADGKRLKLNGLKDSLAGERACDAQSLIDLVLRTVDRFRDQHPLSDDLTLVAIQLPALSEARAGALSRSTPA